MTTRFTWDVTVDWNGLRYAVTPMAASTLVLAYQTWKRGPGIMGGRAPAGLAASLFLAATVAQVWPHGQLMEDKK